MNRLNRSWIHLVRLSLPLSLFLRKKRKESKEKEGSQIQKAYTWNDKKKWLVHSHPNRYLPLSSTNKRGRKKKKERKRERKKWKWMSFWSSVTGFIFVTLDITLHSFLSSRVSKTLKRKRKRERERERRKRIEERKWKIVYLFIKLTFFIPKTPTIYFFKQRVEEDTFEFTHEWLTERQKEIESNRKIEEIGRKKEWMRKSSDKRWILVSENWMEKLAEPKIFFAFFPFFFFFLFLTHHSR